MMWKLAVSDRKALLGCQSWSQSTSMRGCRPSEIARGPVPLGALVDQIRFHNYRVFI